MTNIYDQLNTSALVAGIQRGALQLLDPELKKNMSSDKISRMKRDMDQMRYEVIPRLRKLNRMDPLFFQVGVHVLYHKWSPPQDIDDWGPSKAIPDRHGVVIGHEDGKVLVRFDKDEYHVRVMPADLKIKFIR